MKTRETKQKDLTALTESLAASKSAMVVSFSGVTVAKDQEFRSSLRAAGAQYEVVKNTLARIAVKGTPFEEASEHFKGVTAIAWTQDDPIVLSKAISKFMKDNADIYTFKTGVVDGKLVDLTQLTTIANLPSKEELISKLMWVLNSGAQRLVTIINAVPRDLAVVIKQIGEQEGRAAGTPTADAVAAEPVVEQSADQEPSAATEEVPVEKAEDAQQDREDQQDATSPEGEQAAEAQEESAAASPDDKAEEVLDTPAEGEEA